MGNRASSTLAEGPLESTTSRLQKEGSSFRLLVLGKSGVGKSTLINRTFGLNDKSMTSHHASGVHDINKEIYPPSNRLLVVHDSQGYEAGEEENLGIVQKFIAERASRTNPAERLHCAWVCIQTPTSGGRILERGTEKVLQQLSTSRVPFVIVFTQYDLLIDCTLADVYRNMKGSSREEIDAESARQAERIFDTRIKPQIEDFMTQRGEIVAVSSEDTGRLQELVRRTIAEMEKIGMTVPGTHPDRQTQPTNQSSSTPAPQERGTEPEVFDSSIRAGMAQRIDPETTIRTIAKIGRKKYWSGMASSTHFRELRLKQCLEVLHTDIVKPWNFEAKDEKHLASPEFGKSISELVNDVGDSPRPRSGSARLRNLAGTPGVIAGIIGASVAAALPTGPAAPAVGPAIFVGLVFAKWVYEVYQETPETLRRIMEYIIHLTIVLLIVDERANTVENDKSSSIKKRASEAHGHYKSELKEDIQREVKDFIGEQPWKRIVDRDCVFDKVEKILLDALRNPKIRAGGQTSSSS